MLDPWYMLDRLGYANVQFRKRVKTKVKTYFRCGGEASQRLFRPMGQLFLPEEQRIGLDARRREPDSTDLQ